MIVSNCRPNAMALDFLISVSWHFLFFLTSLVCCRQHLCLSHNIICPLNLAIVVYLHHCFVSMLDKYLKIPRRLKSQLLKRFTAIVCHYKRCVTQLKMPIKSRITYQTCPSPRSYPSLAAAEPRLSRTVQTNQSYAATHQIALYGRCASQSHGSHGFGARTYLL